MLFKYRPSKLSCILLQRDIFYLWKNFSILLYTEFYTETGLF